MSDAFSPIITVGACVLPLVIVGMIEASTTRSPSKPLTLKKWQKMSKRGFSFHCCLRNYSRQKCRLVAQTSVVDPQRRFCHLHCPSCRYQLGDKGERFDAWCSKSNIRHCRAANVNSSGGFASEVSLHTSWKCLIFRIFALFSHLKVCQHKWTMSLANQTEKRNLSEESQEFPRLHFMQRKSLWGKSETFLQIHSLYLPEEYPHLAVPSNTGDLWLGIRKDLHFSNVCIPHWLAVEDKAQTRNRTGFLSCWTRRPISANRQKW